MKENTNKHTFNHPHHRVSAQYLHHGSGSGVDQEQRWQRRHGNAQQAEVLHDL